MIADPKVFSPMFLDALSASATSSPRRRQHANIHASHAEPCQRFFNAVEPDSYLRPHRQALVPRDKLLVGIRGRFVAVLFDDAGTPRSFIGFGAQSPSAADAAALEIPAGHWNTVLSLERGSILLEVKAGPFDPDGPREPAPWAPEEGTDAARAYLAELRQLAAAHR